MPAESYNNPPFQELIQLSRESPRLIKTVPYDSEYRDAYWTIRTIERYLFNDFGFFSFEVCDEETDASINMEKMRIYFSRDLYESILKMRHKNKRDLLLYIISHEISHFIIESFCESPQNNYSIQIPCLDNSVDVNSPDFYEFLSIYSQNHLVVERLNYFILQNFQVNFLTIRRFLSSSLKEADGPSYRIIELDREYRRSRIDIFRR